MVVLANWVCPDRLITLALTYAFQRMEEHLDTPEPYTLKDISPVSWTWTTYGQTKEAVS